MTVPGKGLYIREKMGHTELSQPPRTMAISDRLQSRLDSYRAVRSLEAARAEKKRKANRLFLTGVALAAVTSAAAFSVGIKHPASTLPATPVAQVTPVTSVATPAPQVETAPVEAKVPAQKPPSKPLVGNPDPAATCDGANKFSSGCSAEQAAANKQAYWDEQNRREAEKRADCRAGIIDRDTCNQLVWDWETRI